MALVTYQEQDAFSLITLDDGKANALSFAMADGLDSALDQGFESGKVIVLAGRPGKFCAGFDLNVMGKMDADSQRLLRRGADIAGRLAHSQTPVIAAVTGHALAMGALICLSVDYRLGCRGAFKLGLNEVAIGMTLPWFGIELAQERVIEAHAHQVVTLARIYDPEGAAEAGILDACCAPENLMAEAASTAQHFAALDMPSFAATKARLREGFASRWDTAMARDFG
ncbi:crotonase/enoyl-CoA hydratase family protein [Luminiphilus sp. nBUS_07]|uniref:crotonase/enoyl-CoA hydratase family protein n=1 Tax=Luminiphilus sp. nBUS_07 TaxID=3395314 RepID=UPI003EB86C47